LCTLGYVSSGKIKRIVESNILFCTLITVVTHATGYIERNIDWI
jgi:hypothetical protein